MLEKESLFAELLKASKTSVEKDSIKKIFNMISDFYYVLDIHNECNVNLEIFNYLFSDLEVYTIEKIAEKVYMSDRTIRRFKQKTERVIIVLISTDRQFEAIKHILPKHKNV